MSDIQDIIIHYLDSTANPEEKIQLLHWLRASESNKQEFQEIRDLWLRAGSVQDPDDITDFALEKFKNRIKQSVNIRSVKKRSVYPFIRIVAVFLLAFGLNYTFFKLTESPLQEPLVINRLITSDFGKGRFVLPDSTVVWLNKNSSLEYPESFNSSRRFVKLEGEAYFQVSSNPNAIFHVGAGDVEIKVTGTSFVIQNYEKRKTTEAILVSGQVFVGNNRSDDDIELFPNQRFTWEKGKYIFNVDSVNAQDYVTWINNRLIFDNSKFSDILVQMQEWYGVDIICPADFARNTRTTFTIRDESIEDILNAIRRIVPIHYKWEGHSLYINPKK